VGKDGCRVHDEEGTMIELRFGGVSRPYRARGDVRRCGMGPRAAPWALLSRPFGAGEDRHGFRG
jgi:hypothetical protein